MTIEVRKLNLAGDVTVAYRGAASERGPAHIVVQAEWTRADRDLGYTVFQTGDRFTEYFYADQWFNVLRVASATTGALKGWYCNISRPARILPDAVSYVDLFLDAWISPTGAAMVLDEDEFAAAPLDEATRAAARAALAELLRWVAERRAPFADLGASPT